MVLTDLVQHRQADENATAGKGPRAAASGFRQPAIEAASSASKEEHMDPLTVAASVVLVLVLAIFAVISIFALMGQDSRRW